MTPEQHRREHERRLERIGRRVGRRLAKLKPETRGHRGKRRPVWSPDLPEGQRHFASVADAGRAIGLPASAQSSRISFAIRNGWRVRNLRWQYADDSGDGDAPTNL